MKHEESLGDSGDEERSIEIQEILTEAAKNNIPRHDLAPLNEYLERVQRAQALAAKPVELLFTPADKMDLAWLKGGVTVTDIVEQIDWARSNPS